MDSIKLLKLSEYYDSIGDHQKADSCMEKFSQLNTSRIVPRGWKLNQSDVVECKKIVDELYNAEVLTGTSSTDPLIESLQAMKVFYMPAMKGSGAHIASGSGEFESRTTGIGAGTPDDEVDKHYQALSGKTILTKPGENIDTIIDNFINNTLYETSKKGIKYIALPTSYGGATGIVPSEFLETYIKSEIGSKLNTASQTTRLMNEIISQCIGNDIGPKNDKKIQEVLEGLKSSQKGQQDPHGINRAVFLEDSGPQSKWQKLRHPQQAYLRYITVMQNPTSQLAYAYKRQFMKMTGDWAKTASKISALVAKGFSIGTMEEGRMIPRPQATSTGTPTSAGTGVSPTPPAIPAPTPGSTP